MSGSHKVGISSFAYSFACGNRPFMKPEYILSPVELIDKAAAAGAEVIQFGDNMPLEKYADKELKRIHGYSEDRGIELEVGMRKATAERLSEYIRITNMIGARVLRMISDGPGFEPDVSDLCSILSSVTPCLEENGVVLGLENHDRFHAYEYARIIEKVGHPQIGLTVDTVNSLSLEEPVDEVLKYMAPYCVCLHIKDYVIKRNNGGGGLMITGALTGTGRLDIYRCYDECRRKSDADFNIILESWMASEGTLENTLRMEDDWAKAGITFLKNMINKTK